MRKLSLSIVLSILLCSAKSQIITQITHYSVDNGLSENHIICMLQDSKGIMWFGTFDGLNKFDGYSFRNFKGGLTQKYQLVNFKVDRLKEDGQGFLWLQTNDERIFRFDPATETFLPVPQCVKEYSNYKNPLNRITILSDGTIWLYHYTSTIGDCFKVENIKSEQKIKLTHITTTNKGNHPSHKINKIFLDKNRDTWILRSNGIDFLKKGSSTPHPLFLENQNGDFFSICENSNKIYVGGKHGELLVLGKNNGSLDIIKTNIKSDIVDIQQLNPNELFLLTNSIDFYIYSIATKSFQVFRLNNLKGKIVYSCYKDRHGNVWLDTDFQGGILFDYRTKTINYLSVDISKYANSITHKFNIIEDKFNNIWIQTRKNGFYKYNNDKNRLELIPILDSDKKSFSELIHISQADKQGNLWVNTYLQGVDKIVFRKSPFEFTKQVDVPLYSPNNEIRSVFQDNKNRIWVGTKKGLVYIYDENKKFLGLLGFDGSLNSKNPFNFPVYDIMEDHTGTIWLATKGEGLFRLVPKSNDAYSITNYKNNPKDLYSISSNSVYSSFEDHLHRIWIATLGGGLNLLNTDSVRIRFVNHKNTLKNYPTNNCLKVRYITEDGQNNMFVGTTQGLLVFRSEKKNPDEIIFKRYVRDSKNKYSLSGNDIQYILPSKKGDVYFALMGGGVNVIKGGFKSTKVPNFEILKSIYSASLNVVYTLKEDKKGCVWMSNQTQIIKYNPLNSKIDLYKPVSKNDYFFDEAAVCETNQGGLIYGTSDGFISFDPLKISKSDFIPRICLTQLQIFNKPVEVGNEGSPLKKTIDDTKELVSTHKQNIFSIEYAAIDYINPQEIQYAYKLEGMESEWNYVGNQRIANYINLPKGRYVFHVKSTNSDGEWTNNERTIAIIKLPSFWESTWGLIFYCLLFVLLSALTTYILFTIYKLRNEIDIEHRITNMKLRFFTDISHELRTPLTLIASPVDNVLRKETLSTNAREQLQVVQRNTSRMLRLINQILDFRKIQSKKLKLIIEVINVADFLDEIKMNFIKLAEEKNIGLQITDHTGNTQLWVDKDKFEKIFYNLLSNTFKFSPAKNQIDIIISDDAENVSITIQDKGIGISKDKLKFLFERFESFATSNIVLQASTGIGLSLTKELVDLHRAKIEVESELGKGSAFKVTFKKGFEHFGKDKEFLLRDLEAGEINLEQSQLTNQEEKIEIASETHPDKKPTVDLIKILIVEDNNELRNFLKSALTPNYEVYTAENGRIALEIALTYFPDMIISDIMMPDMDGLELARSIKENANISHIPIILLTAKTDIESKLEALELGADDYITKPFSLAYLEARVENLLKIRSQLQGYFKSTLTSGIIALSKPDITNLDEVFIKKTMKFLEENYENSNMIIDDISVFTGLSRSSFFKKVKSLTGLAPVDFIREFRLQKAIQIIEAGETNISQIAYSVGINDTRYFSKCFKQKFGMNPSEYISKKTS
jgi:signal transduction histidine kinase/DNA-binding response OmpR family regulator/ligand-binding sensor domain-containing protein